MILIYKNIYKGLQQKFKQQVVKYYNKRSCHIVRLPDSDQFICYNCVELEPVSKEIDYDRVKKILDTKKK